MVLASERFMLQSPFIEYINKKVTVNATQNISLIFSYASPWGKMFSIETYLAGNGYSLQSMQC